MVVRKKKKIAVSTYVIKYHCCEIMEFSEWHIITIIIIFAFATLCTVVSKILLHLFLLFHLPKQADTYRGHFSLVCLCICLAIFSLSHTFCVSLTGQMIHMFLGTLLFAIMLIRCTVSIPNFACICIKSLRLYSFLWQSVD